MLMNTPLIQEIVADSKRDERVQATLDFLDGRFGPVPTAISAGLNQVKTQEALMRLTREAATCASLQAFELALHDVLPKPKPASTRGRKPRKPTK